MSFACNQVCRDSLPRFCKRCGCQNPVCKWQQYVTRCGYLQPGAAGAVGEGNWGGWCIPATGVCSVLLGLEKACTLLLRNYCPELPWGQRASGSCRNAALLTVLPAQKSRRDGCYKWPGLLVLTCFSRRWASQAWIAPLHFLFQARSQIHLYLQKAWQLRESCSFLESSLSWFQLG